MCTGLCITGASGPYHSNSKKVDRKIVTLSVKFKEEFFFLSSKYLMCIYIIFCRANGESRNELNNQKLKKAEILFPEESPRTYKVHFPQEKPLKAEKHYKISGPVEPDSVRYQ